MGHRASGRHLQPLPRVSDGPGGRLLRHDARGGHCRDEFRRPRGPDARPRLLLRGHGGQRGRRGDDGGEHRRHRFRPHQHLRLAGDRGRGPVGLAEGLAGRCHPLGGSAHGQGDHLAGAARRRHRGVRLGSRDRSVRQREHRREHLLQRALVPPGRPAAGHRRQHDPVQRSEHIGDLRSGRRHMGERTGDAPGALLSDQHVDRGRARARLLGQHGAGHTQHRRRGL